MKEKLQTEMKLAMKAKEQEKVLVLRGLIADIKTAEVAPGAKSPLPEQEIVAILKRSVKRREESAEAFRKGGREELAAKEEREIEFVKPYLPKEIGEEEVKKIVQETLAELKIDSPKQQGLAMKTIMAKHPGQLNGKLVSKLVSEALNQS